MKRVVFPSLTCFHSQFPQFKRRTYRIGFGLTGGPV